MRVVSSGISNGAGGCDRGISRLLLRLPHIPDSWHVTADTSQQLEPLGLALHEVELILRAKCVHLSLSAVSMIRHNDAGNFVSVR